MDDGAPTIDEVFDVLSDRRRRTALEVLIAHEVPLALADLADEVAVREHEARITEISEETVRDVYLSLYHKHVPKLREANVVRYDQDRDLVALTDHADHVEGFMHELDPRFDDPDETGAGVGG